MKNYKKFKYKTSVLNEKMADMDVDQPTTSTDKGPKKRFEVKKVSCLTLVK